MKPNYSVLVAALFLTLEVANLARAADNCCQTCGCNNGCEKVCRLVREDKKVNITCWGCKCEEFCAPGRSHRGCKNCEDVCQDCDPTVCSESKPFVWYDWEPGCAKHIYTKKKLMKTTVTKTIPGFKWVVEDLCPNCQATCPCALIPAGVTVPTPPVPEARLISGIPLNNSPSGAEFVPVNASRSGHSWLVRSLFGSGSAASTPP